MKHTRRARRRARGKRKSYLRALMHLRAPWDIERQREEHMADAIGYAWGCSPTGRIPEMTERYRGTFHNMELRPGYVVQGSIRDPAEVLTEYRQISVADWAGLEARVRAHAPFTMDTTKLTKLIDDSLRETLLHGSSKLTTKGDER